MTKKALKIDGHLVNFRARVYNWHWPMAQVYLRYPLHLSVARSYIYGAYFICET